jgi:phage terminase large subunit
MQIKYPENLLFLINSPARYKVLYGGRGAGKTETIALALIILARSRKLRIACFRELQKSIDESVYETLKNRIIDLGFENEFDIQKTTIISLKTGSEFIFSGLRYQINSIKSMARIDIAWVEEASNTSKTTWTKLPPTIRGLGRLEGDTSEQGGPFGKGPEIWISFNPELDTDEVYERFVKKRDKWCPEFITNDKGEQERYSHVMKLNWNDNPFLPNDSRIEMEVMKVADEDEWLHVWEGNIRQTLTGAIYAKEIKKVLLEGRRGKVEYDPSRPVNTFWDLGHDDYTSIWFVQQVGVEYNLIKFYQNRLEKLAHYIEYLQSCKYNYGVHYLPHDADNETLASRSVKRIMLGSYPGKVRVVPRVSQKVLGIRAGRQIFDLCNFDEENTGDGWQCLCRYEYDVDENGKFSLNPKHNEYSHGADAWQTMALHLKPEQAMKKKQPKLISSGRVLTINRTGNNWMGG